MNKIKNSFQTLETTLKLCTWPREGRPFSSVLLQKVTGIQDDSSQILLTWP